MHGVSIRAWVAEYIVCPANLFTVYVLRKKQRQGSPTRLGQAGGCSDTALPWIAQG